MTSVNAAESKPRKSALGIFAWWKVSPAEVDRQIAGYKTLRFWQSARGSSALLCLLTFVVTVLIGMLRNVSIVDHFTDAMIWLVMALFMFLGQRWAFVVGMILWTIEKAMLLTSQMGGAAAPVVQIIWWCIYMQAFFLAYRVETQRKALSR